LSFCFVLFGMQKQIAFPKASDASTHRIPSLIATPKGTLLAFSDYRVGSNGDFAHRTDIVVRRSLDGGTSWLPIQTLASAPETTHHGSPALVDRITGRVFKTYTARPSSLKGPPDQHRWWQEQFGGDPGKGGFSWIIHSDDEGETWSEAQPLSCPHPRVKGVHGSANGIHGVQLEDGRLVIPYYGYLKSGITSWGYDGKSDGLSHLIISEDHGQTWKPGAAWVVDHGPHEYAIAALPGNRLYLNRRTLGPFRASAVLDDVASAEDPDFRVDETLPEPICHAAVLFAEDPDGGAGSGRLLFANPAVRNDTRKFQGELRRRLTVRSSTDEGRTWSRSLLVEEGFGGYCDLAQLPDGTIACIYETGEEKYDDALALARFFLHECRKGD